MQPTVGQRIKLIEEAVQRINAQMARLNVEIQNIVREISLDIPERQE